MKFFVQAVLGLGFGVMAWTSFPQAAHADKAPDCMQSDTRGLPEGRLQEWWDKRSPEQQKYIRELPCKERYIPMTCIALFDPDLKECTNKGVIESRASRSCEGKGMDIMSEEFAACKEKYKKTAAQPFP